MPAPAPKKPAEPTPYGFVLDIRADPSTAANPPERFDVTVVVTVTNDGQPFYDARFAWRGVFAPIVNWLWDQFSALTGSKYFGGGGLTYLDVVRVEGLFIKILAELNRRTEILAKTPGDKIAAAARLFR